MIKTLSTDTSSFKFYDNETNINLTASKNGVYFVDKSLDAKVYIKQKNGGYIKNIQANWANRTVYFSSSQLSDLPVGSYEIELWLSNSDGYSIFPESGFVSLFINENTTNLDGKIISSITLEDFQKQFDELKQDVINQSGVPVNGSVSLNKLDSQLRNNFVSVSEYTPQLSGDGGVNVSGGVVTGFGAQNYWSHAQYNVTGGLNLYVSFCKSNNTAVTGHIFATDDDNKVLYSFVQGSGETENIDDYEIVTPEGTTKLFIQSFQKYTISVSGETYKSLSETINENNTNLSSEFEDKLKIYKEINNSNIYNFISRQGTLNGYPENSMPAILNVKQNGFNYVRVSVSLTSDNVPVLIHDTTINRVARNSDGSVISSNINISDITLEQANTYDWGIAAGEKYKGMKIPLLSDFLKICSFKSIFPTLEFKPTTATDEQLTSVINMVNQYGLSDKTYFTSTVDAILLSVNKINTAINIGFIAQLNLPVKVDYALQFKTSINHVRIDMFDTDTPSIDVINYASSKGIGIKVGSAYSIADIVKFASMGVTDVEVANVAFPASTLNEYYDNL